MSASERANFWRNGNGYVRIPWKLGMFVLVVGLVANPLVLALDATNIPVIENSFRNLCVMIGILAALWVVAKLDKELVSRFGVGFWPGFAGRFAIGILVGLALMTAIIGIGIVMGKYRFRFDPQTRFECVIGLALGSQVLRYLAGSIFEESFSRGLLFRLTKDGWPQVSTLWRNTLTVLVTAFLFGVLHVGNPDITYLGLLNLSLVGIVFGLLYLRSGDLWMPVGAHLAWNVVQNNVFGLGNSGQASNATLMIDAKQMDSIWTGGSFGPEGGVIAGLVLGVAIAVIWRQSIGKEPGWRGDELHDNE